MEETIEKLREYVESVKQFDGEEGKHYAIINLLARSILIMHDQGQARGFIESDLPIKTLAELEKHL